MNLEELEAQVNASPALRNLRDRCTSEMSQQMGGDAQISVILILSLISLAIQVIEYCRNKNKADLLQDMRDIRKLPHHRLLRLKRQANKLWRREFPDTPVGLKNPNPMLEVLYSLGENADEAALKELLTLAHVPD